MYCSATSHPVWEMTQKYGGDLMYPICRESGMTHFVLCLSEFGRTCAKFHSSPSSQSNLQNPSFMSHFSMKTFVSSVVLENTWMIRLSKCPSWSMALMVPTLLRVHKSRGLMCHPVTVWKMTSPQWYESSETYVESLILVRFLTVGLEHHRCLCNQQSTLAHTALSWPLLAEVV